MQMYLTDDLGTLHLNMLGSNLWFCDNESYECYEFLENRLKSIHGNGFVISSLMFDTYDGSVSVFRDGSVMPFVKISMCNFFKISCDLQRFVNIFTRKVMIYENGCFKFHTRGKKYKVSVPGIHNSLLLFLLSHYVLFELVSFLCTFGA